MFMDGIGLLFGSNMKDGDVKVVVLRRTEDGRWYGVLSSEDRMASARGALKEG